MHILQGPRLIAEPDTLKTVGEWDGWSAGITGRVTQRSEHFPLLQTAIQVVERWNNPQEVDFRKLFYECLERYDHTDYEESVLPTDGTHWPLWRFGMDTWQTGRMVSIVLCLKAVLTTLVMGSIPREPVEDDYGDAVVSPGPRVVTLESDRNNLIMSEIGARYRDDRNLPSLMEGLMRLCEASLYPGTVKYALVRLAHARYLYESPFMVDDSANMPPGSFVSTFKEYELGRWKEVSLVQMAESVIYGEVRYTLREADDHLAATKDILAEWEDEDDLFCPANYLKSALEEALKLPRYR